MDIVHESRFILYMPVKQGSLVIFLEATVLNPLKLNKNLKPEC